MSLNGVGRFLSGRIVPSELGFQQENGFVIVMDLLGVKRILERMTVQQFFNRSMMVNAFIENSLIPTTLSYQKHNFSDTIIITINLNNHNNNNLIRNIRTIGRVLSSIICVGMDNIFFYRGAISYGKYWKSSSSIIGPAIYDASICHEEPQLIGIVAGKDFSDLLNRINEFENLCNPFIRANVPLNNGSVDGWIIDWEDTNSVYLNLLRENMQQDWNNIPVRRKYLNTINAQYRSDN